MSNEEINKTVDVKGADSSFEILNERPDGMSFEDYKTFQKIQKKMLKKRKKGKIVWLSKLEATPGVLHQLTQDNMMNSLGKLIQTGETFTGSTKDLK